VYICTYGCNNFLTSIFKVLDAKNMDQFISIQSINLSFIKYIDVVKLYKNL